jgi:PPOX class probable F420-dependent enzyme
MASMSKAEMTAFLAETRLGMLTTLRADGSPVTVPVWFEWDGATARMFSSADAGKVRRLQRDARATLVVPNHVTEAEQWVAFDGEIAVSGEGAFDLAERMAHRYWDLGDAKRRAELESWRKAAPYLRLLELRPSRVRTSKG